MIAIGPVSEQTNKKPEFDCYFIFEREINHREEHENPIKLDQALFWLDTQQIAKWTVDHTTYGTFNKTQEMNWIKTYKWTGFCLGLSSFTINL